ncbi:uncharacterized protein LOC108674181 [Hyalella azteca]|uniref:Uncharacterized protein LOC108674181 n=1 Tax=Hyalella azteca TaxID=294128 RepID=A0A8B7NXH7_HYAAZ|nr:uncharacterized protein LOC108674181 [Hyalella azteca]
MATVRITLSLILPLLFYVPHCFLAEAVCNKQGTGWNIKSNGTEELVAWQVWAWIVELCHRLLPSLFIVIFNAKVILKVRKVNKQFRDKNSVNRQPLRDSKLSKKFSLEPSHEPIQEKPGNQDGIREPPDNQYGVEDRTRHLLAGKDTAVIVKAQVEEHKIPSKDTLRYSSKDSIRNVKGHQKRDQLEKKLSNLLLAIIVVFLVTTLPAALLALSDNSDSDFESFGYEIFRGVANMTELVGFSANFVLYFIFVSEFQDWLQAACIGRARRRLHLSEPKPPEANEDERLAFSTVMH